MIRINLTITASDLVPAIDRLWALSSEKLDRIEARFNLEQGSPVFTDHGKYRSQGWTEWTLGFHYGSSLLQFDATDDETFLQRGQRGTVAHMANHLTHMGVHDHGFNTVSTFGNLWRLGLEGRLDQSSWERDYYELALRCSSAVQARRWTPIPDGGYIYSFNGPHSLFADTMRSLRILALGHRLGHVLMGENDLHISLLDRLVQHARTTASYIVYYGETRDIYDERGRVAHESIFNTNDGNFRCPSTQQGYSSRTTWTRALAWVMLGFAEQLEFLETVPDSALEELGGRQAVRDFMLKAAAASCDYYIESSPTNGIPYWDTGAPGLARLPRHREEPADPFNDFEPVDSSAATIAAQGLLRLGRYLKKHGDEDQGRRYWQAGLTAAAALFDSPYLSSDTGHEGLILHSVYHRPNGWDSVPEGRAVPSGESSMWGDYHARELALYLQRVGSEGPYLTFFAGKD